MIDKNPPPQNEEVSEKKSPGFWFYPADYERDMQMLPLAAQGLWMRMLCWMSENEMHRGFLELPTGLPMSDQDIARRAGISVKETRRLLVCMERIGTFSKDERGCLLSRRMARDTHISVVRRMAAIKRATLVERAKHGEFAPAKPPAKPEQTPTVTASASDTVSVSASDTTSAALSDEEIRARLRNQNPPPPLKNGTHKKPEDRLRMVRDVELHEHFKTVLKSYPGAQCLCGNPDDKVIGECIQICRQRDGVREEEALNAALVEMARGHKAPSSSWMWFPTVMKQYLGDPRSR